MLPIERQQRIKTMIQSKQHMKIAELSERLGVSEMTIHRDLKPLIEEGLIIKTFGGITLLPNPGEKKEQHEVCVLCRRPYNERSSYRLILPNHAIEVACCPHCGLLRHYQLGDKVIQAICYDFLRHTTISAPLAFFVMETSLDTGCCNPQVLPFEYQDHAEKFIKGFGGQVYRFDEVGEALQRKMQAQEQHHCHE
ncbi:DeoR/GlpR family transcriptional regulator of sugar metabolism [Pullulanibacillus pueri]|uniref:HTH-type transcriptional repressor YcnK n=1 Tax=Pullulanibacillus pueri TaxID=1437324 RepID=A0A8J2ZYK0_9BACL|nr:DeoR family transcriptional regulator [Pullulanibacillus pueri]MBM7680525.1 DeoR/GlpR family transcriptional regulator of sugar metabolism [Pullulanibacillus pueri]GGH86115.1 HTH-type transcriptional repressor YcnK [Pullulanibacillus pueri]